MKKVLGLLFISSSIFSMQLDVIGINCERAKRLNYQLAKHSRSKSDMNRNSIKEYQSKINDKTKQPIQSSSFSAPIGLGKIELFHSENGFQVEHQGKTHQVQQVFTDKLVRKATTLDIKDFQRSGKAYFYIKQMGNGQFSLDVLDRAPGSGPALGFFAYCATKVVCYSVMTAAAVAAVYTGGAITIGQVSPSNRDRAMGALRQMSNDGLAYGVTGGLMYAGANSTVPMITTTLPHITTVAAAATVAKGVGTATVAVTGAKIGTALALANSTAVTTGAVVSTAKIMGTTAMGLSGAGVLFGSAAITGAGLAPEAAALTVAGGMSTAGTGLGIAASIELLALKVGLFFGMMPTP